MATDLLGLGSNTANVVTVRPTDTRVFAAVDTWGKDCTSPTAGDGTRVPAAFVNGLLAQMRTAIRQGGVTEDNADDAMLWKAMQAAAAAVGQKALPGALARVATVTSDTQVSITADAVVLVSAAGKTVLHRNVNLTLSTAVSGVGGLDTGGVASSTWYHLWLVSDGTTLAGVLSLSATAPTVAGQYLYALRVAAVRVDGSGKLWRTKTYGNRTIIRRGTNPANPPTIAVGPAGTFATPIVPQAVSISSFVPPTAQAALILSNNAATSSGCCQVYLGASSALSQPQSTNPGLWSADQQYDASTMLNVVDLESSNIYWYAGSNNGVIYAAGWLE